MTSAVELGKLREAARSGNPGTTLALSEIWVADKTCDQPDEEKSKNVSCLALPGVEPC